MDFTARDAGNEARQREKRSKGNSDPAEMFVAGRRWSAEVYASPAPQNIFGRLRDVGQGGSNGIEAIMPETLKPGDLIDMLGSRFEMVALMGAEDSDTVLFRTRMAPGKLVPLHSHIDPECFYLLEGEIEAFVVDEGPTWRGVGAGKSLLVADGVKHAIRNPTESTADMVLATNNRLASFFAEAGRSVAPDTAFSPPSPDDIQRVMQVSKAYGYWNASPAESAAVTG
jgi:quercetin dioxygenase-like cupin family protein